MADEVVKPQTQACIEPRSLQMRLLCIRKRDTLNFDIDADAIEL